MEPSNADRAEWAAVGLKAFADECGLTRSGDAEDKELLVSDFLSDLMHYCTQNDIVFSVCLARGKGNYEEEAAEEE